MKILIFGGCGFVGSNLAFKFKEQGNDITVFDNLVRRGVELNLPLFKQKGIKFIHGDVRNKEDFNKITDKIDIILDCAAQPSAINYQNPVFDITNNYLGVLNVLEYCRKYKCGLIFWSTNKCYTGEVCNIPKVKIKKDRFVWCNNPDLPGWSKKYGFNEQLTVNGKDHSIYGVSKINADLLIQEWSDAYGINSIINRWSCLAGPNQWGISDQGWVAWFMIANYFKIPLTVYGFNGYQVRDYLFTDDINYLVNKQINQIHEHKGSVFNVGGGKDFSVSINEAIKFINNNYNQFTGITKDDTQRRADQQLYITDNRLVKETFEWKPTVNFATGCLQIYNWIKIKEQEIKELYL
jgi:CDP-paratose 2-epimerase